MGRPLLYGTTPLFLEQFALRHLGELPRGDELAIALRDPNAPPLTARNESEIPREPQSEPLQLAGSDDERADENSEQHRLADAQA
jgi:segregation and condensation protein B